MILDFQIISHKIQRYDTVGDYFRKKGRWIFRISKMKDKRYSVLVFLHEVIEFFMCQMMGVKVDDIDLWDMVYEDARRLHDIGAPNIFIGKYRREGIIQPGDRAPCGCYFREEPGDDIHAPYHRAHVIATECERLICEALGIKWEQYCAVIEEL